MEAKAIKTGGLIIADLVQGIQLPIWSAHHHQTSPTNRMCVSVNQMVLGVRCIDTHGGNTIGECEQLGNKLHKSLTHLHIENS